MSTATVIPFPTARTRHDGGCPVRYAGDTAPCWCGVALRAARQPAQPVRPEKPEAHMTIFDEPETMTRAEAVGTLLDGLALVALVVTTIAALYMTGVLG